MTAVCWRCLSIPLLSVVCWVSRREVRYMLTLSSGFPTKDQGQQYCNNNYDQCCTVNGLIQVKSAPLPTVSPTPPPAPASSGPNILIIALGAGGGAVLLIVVVTLICCIARSKKNIQAMELQEPPTKYAHNQGRSNTNSSGYSKFSEGKRSFEDRQLQGQYGGGGYMTPEGPTATRRPSGGGSQQGGYGFPNYAAPANGLHGAQNQFNNPYNQPPINHFNHQGQNPYVHQPQNQYMQQSQPMPYNGLAQQPEKRNSQYKNIIPAQHQQAWNTPPMPSGTMALQRQNSISNKTYWVILNFRAENSDEMNLCEFPSRPVVIVPNVISSVVIGDVVTVAQIYDDGWCFGRKEGAQGAEGVFPFECVAEAPNMKSNTPGKSKFNNRASSLYGSSVEQHLEDGEYRVLYPYIPAMADELQLGELADFLQNNAF
ncbi:hypothetical protein BC830DRAFT_672317 [Chytriomyces sp. MP71]|nr:hypothetical protein BC830DRAFT_672317 [Chytriomyces sp. MP71]